MSFLGEFEHSLDEKGRVILPADFRPPLAAGAVLGIQLAGCLSVWTKEEFDQVAAGVQAQARTSTTGATAARFFFANAKEFTPDAQGRVAIPQKLRDFARLERELVIVGVENRIEIWDRSRWSELEHEGANALASGDLVGFGL
jgi:MraZ protein